MGLRSTADVSSIFEHAGQELAGLWSRGLIHELVGAACFNDAPAVDLCRAAVRMLQSGEDAQERGFAAPSVTWHSLPVTFRISLYQKLRPNCKH